MTQASYPTPGPYARGIVWFRRDLRASDHAALHYALASCRQVFCVFVFDREILDSLPRADRRVEFIHGSVLELDAALRERGGALIVRHAWAKDEIARLAVELKANAVFTNHDYEPQAIARDAYVARELAHAGISFHSYKDQVIFERDEVLTKAGGAFSVFTPYKNAWHKKLNPFYLQEYQSVSSIPTLAKAEYSGTIPSLHSMGFEQTNLRELGITPGESGAQALLSDFLSRMDDYDHARDFPAIKGVSYLSVHLRFGTVSIRQLARHAVRRIQALDGSRSTGAQTWLSELIWRDFYFQVLHHHPRVVTCAFKRAYDRIVWHNSQAQFAAWCEGRTGYPIVDAAMAQINHSGYMHNRLRMIVASFLTKDLGIDWRWGERYFAEKLIDFDLSANNGGWQWAASSGCDAQPYFRIFNPVTQSEKFDPQGKFIRRYLPQLSGLPDREIHAPWLAKPVSLEAANLKLGHDYPLPVVQHDEARAQTLARYAVVK
jgi:deoxyribodipyrimidine photo-lyase